ncbi:MAG: hypothetical protein ACE5GB_13175, partial [Acidimicrobiales bacterium]
MSDDDPNEHEGFRIIEGGEPADDDVVAPGRSVFGDDDDSFDDDDAALPHWSEPATGAIPTVGAGSEPSNGSTPEPMLVEAEPDEMAVWADISSTPRWADEGDLPPVEPLEMVGHEAAGDEFFAFDDGAPGGLADGYAAPGPVEPGPPGAAPPPSPPSGRDMPAAVLVGGGLAALVLLAMAAGPGVALVVVTVALGLAAVEFFNAVRLAGHQPAVLLGLTAVVTLPLAVYWRGEAAFSVVLVLTMVFGSLWYLTGVGAEAPLRGLGVTVLGVVYIGVLGAHAAL